MDVRRLVEIWSPGGGRSATGYLISPRLILTALHVVTDGVADPAGAGYEFRPLGHDQWLTCRLLAPRSAPPGSVDPPPDVALLESDAPWSDVAGLPEVRWGIASGDEPTPCVAVGFPRAERRPGNSRDTKEARGYIELLTGIKSGLLTVYVSDSSAPRADGQGSPWAGMSGAALFCGDLLTGVVATDRLGSYGTNALSAVPATALGATPDISNALRLAGISVDCRRVGAGTDPLAAWWDLPKFPADIKLGGEYPGVYKFRTSVAPLGMLFGVNYTRNYRQAAKSLAKTAKLDCRASGEFILNFPASGRATLIAALRQAAHDDPGLLALTLREAYDRRPRDVVELCYGAGLPVPPEDHTAQFISARRGSY